jgi:hypothetical protein
MAEESFINDIFSELDSDELQKNIKVFVVKPIISMIYNDLFPYICFFTSILLLCIFLLLFVVFILAFSH